jgi:hypothetical protein
LNRKLGESQSRSGGDGEEKNSQPLPELEPRIIQLVAQHYTTKLSLLLIISVVYTKCPGEERILQVK